MKRDAVREVHGLRLRYVDAGSGPAVVLLHAFPLGSAMWQGQVAALAPRHRVIAPDFRGFGGTPLGSQAVSTMALLAEDVAGLLSQLAIRRAVILGLSMGGYVALALLRLRPDLFRGLVLSSTRASADTEEGQKGREWTAQAVLAKGMEELVTGMLPKLLSPAPSPAVKSTVEQLIRANPPAGAAAALRGMAMRPDSTPLLASIRCPTLVIAAERDALIPVAESEAMQKAIPGARLEVIRGAGHLANLEAPEAYDAALSGFLAAIADSREAT